MIIKSSRKRNHEFIINVQSSNGTNHTLKRKDRIKYLGVMLDETVRLFQAPYRIRLFTNDSKPRNNFQIKRLPNTFPTKTNILQPYISLHLICHLSLGKHLQNLYTKGADQAKPCHQINIFARAFGEQTDSAVLLINLLELLTVNNVYRSHTLRFTHMWHKNLLPNVFHNFFKYASSLHTYNTRYAASQNLYKTRVRTNTGKQTISYMASIFLAQ